MRVPLSPHPLQHRLSLVFLTLTNLTGVRWYLIVVLICIYLIAKDVERDLKCLLAIRSSSVENSLGKGTAHLHSISPQIQPRTSEIQGCLDLHFPDG